MTSRGTDRALPPERRASSEVRAVRLEETWAADQLWDQLAPVIFAVFIASLVTLLVLAYAGVALV
jgi:hypothetical protein